MSKVEAARRRRPGPADPAPVFAALGDPTRLSLVMTLSSGGAKSIALLAADTRLTRQAVTKHLRVLESAGLVASARSGRESRFTYRPEPLAAARICLDAISVQWDDALHRLRVHLEG